MPSQVPTLCEYGQENFESMFVDVHVSKTQYTSPTKGLISSLSLSPRFPGACLFLGAEFPIFSAKIFNFLHYGTIPLDQNGPKWPYTWIPINQFRLLIGSHSFGYPEMIRVFLPVCIYDMPDMFRILKHVGVCLKFTTKDSLEFLALH